MGGTEKFCLKWNDFESNISVAFRELREDKDFFDVTLVASDDEQQVEAHKVILSACSPFFRNILRRNSHQHPLLYLKGVRSSDLQSVLSFMYHGEVNVAQEELNSFLTVAEELRVKGLTQSQNGPIDGSNGSGKSKPSPTSSSSSTTKAPSTSSSSSYQQQQQQAPPTPSSPHTGAKSVRLAGDRVGDMANIPAKRPRTSSLTPAGPVAGDGADDDIQEVVPVKSEPKELLPPSSSSSHQSSFQNQPLVKQDDSVFSEEAYDDYGEDYDEQYVDPSQSQGEGDKGPMGNIVFPKNEDFDDLVRSFSEYIGSGQVRCQICKKICLHSGNMKQHFETHHYSAGGRICSFCQKVFKTKHSLQTHISRVHREEKQQIINSTVK